MLLEFSFLGVWLALEPMSIGLYFVRSASFYFLRRRFLVSPSEVIVIVNMRVEMRGTLPADTRTDVPLCRLSCVIPYFSHKSPNLI
jgi:hypothetical protein